MNRNIVKQEAAKKQERIRKYNLKLDKAWVFWFPRYKLLKELFSSMWKEFQSLEKETDWQAERGDYANERDYMGVNGYGFEFNIELVEYPSDRNSAKVRPVARRIYLTYNSGCRGIGDGRDIGYKNPYDLPEDIKTAPSPDGVFYMVERMKDPRQGGDVINLFIRDKKGKAIKSSTYRLKPNLNIEKVKKDFWTLFGYTD